VEEEKLREEEWGGCRIGNTGIGRRGLVGLGRSRWRRRPEKRGRRRRIWNLCCQSIDWEWSE